MRHTRDDRVWRAVQVLAGLTALAALAILVRNGWSGRQSARALEKMRRQYAAVPARPASEDTAPAGREPVPELRQVDFAALRQGWPDVVAWIQWPLMGLDLPILHGQTNDQYLRALPDGSWSNGGSLFLEANSVSVLDWHAIVYGHNMQDGSMFGQLKRYLEEDFFRQNSSETWFILYTPAGVWQYDVFAVERVGSTDPGVYMVGYQPGEAFTAFVQEMRARSLYDMGVEADGANPVLTLSTCSPDGAARGNRVALHAVRGRRLDGSEA